MAQTIGSSTDIKSNQNQFYCTFKDQSGYLSPPTEEDSESVDSVTASFSSILEASIEQVPSVPSVGILKTQPNYTKIFPQKSMSLGSLGNRSDASHVSKQVFQRLASNISTVTNGGCCTSTATINLLPQMMRTIQNVLPLLLFILLGDSTGQQIFDSTVLFFVALSVVRTLIHFLTLRYRIQMVNSS